MKKLILLVLICTFMATSASAFELKAFTGSGALSEEISWGNQNVRVKSVELTMDIASATVENLVITQGTSGVAYKTQAMNTVKDFVWDTERFVKSGDSMGIAWDNSNARTWVLEVYYEIN